MDTSRDYKIANELEDNAQHVNVMETVAAYK